MNQFTILMALPLFAMAFLTLIVLITLARSRFKAAKAREVDVSYYKVYQGSEEPEHIRKISRNYSNLFEAPVLFYLAVILTMTLKIQSYTLLVLAWTFVILRHFHSYIHCRSNKVIHRFRLFALSVGVLFAYWVVLLINLILMV